MQALPFYLRLILIRRTLCSEFVTRNNSQLAFVKTRVHSLPSIATSRLNPRPKSNRPRKYMR